MDDFVARQLAMLQAAVADYRRGALGLNDLVQRVVAITAALDRPDWSSDIHPLLLSLEQINAAVLIARRGLDPSEHSRVDKSLDDLTLLIARFERIGTAKAGSGP